MISLIIRYSLFAVLSSVINLSTQYVLLKTYQGAYSLYIAMFFGTLTGLIIKYVLDKRFIFKYTTNNKAQDIHKFILYSGMGVFTTLIFWGSELLFDYSINANWSKYLGGAIGLGIGYIVKYQLDKRFVFIDLKGE